MGAFVLHGRIVIKKRTIATYPTDSSLYLISSADHEACLSAEFYDLGSLSPPFHIDDALQISYDFLFGLSVQIRAEPRFGSSPCLKFAAV